MTRPLGTLMLSTTVVLLLTGATTVHARETLEETTDIATEVVAIPPPTGLMTGRVLLKDGITGVPGAELRFSSPVYGEVEKIRTGRDGRFKVRLAVGAYTLAIARRLDIYESPSTYVVPSRGRVRVDFLLLPDVERAPPSPPARAPGDIGPDPRRTEPAVVGTVIDMMMPPDRAWSRRWKEALGFIGSVLAVGLAAH